ncbi:hypothetical protein ACFLYA_00860 [Candidatus Dependentiae bacterium]
MHRISFNCFYCQWKDKIKNLRSPERKKKDRLENLDSFEIGGELIKNDPTNLDNIFVIDTNGAVLPRPKGVNSDFANLVKNFRTSSNPLYLVAHTGQNFKQNKITFNFKPNSICGKHWFAMKFEWKGNANDSPVIITVMDSLGGKDNRYTELVHHYYRMLVWEKVPIL